MTQKPNNLQNLIYQNGLSSSPQSLTLTCRGWVLRDEKRLQSSSHAQSQLKPKESFSRIFSFISSRLEILKFYYEDGQSWNENWLENILHQVSSCT